MPGGPALTSFLAIVLLGLLAAVGYGVAHDLVTAHVCLEYFTVGHDTPGRGPVEQALLWGVKATWWVGLPLGLALAAAARWGAAPRLSWRDLVAPVRRLLLLMGALSLVAGLLGAWLAARGWVVLLEPLASRVPRERHVPFLADLWAHSAAYLVGALGGLATVATTRRRRRRLLVA